jgi:hypothetical protein
MVIDNDVGIVIDHLATLSKNILRVWGFTDVKGNSDPNTAYFQLFSDSSTTIRVYTNRVEGEGISRPYQDAKGI